MNYKEKIEFKKEILEDIYSCFSFDFFNANDNLDMNKMSKLIDKYSNIIEGINNIMK